MSKTNLTLNEIESKMHILEQYLLTLNNKTPHYRDTKKHYNRLKAKMFKEIKKERKNDTIKHI